MGPDELTTAVPGVPDFASRVRELRAAHRVRRIRRYRSVVMHWMGRYLRRTRQPERAPLPAVQPGQVSISFAGHSTVLIRYADCSIVCDPMLGGWVKGVKRAVAPGLSAGDLAGVKLALISHGHLDHLHRPTLRKLPRTATVLVPPRTAQHVSDLDFARLIELRSGQNFREGSVEIISAPVQHGEKNAPALSYIIRGNGPSVYFCGDSGYFRGFAEIGERHQPDIAILPIGGYAPLSFRDRHMSPLDALYALEDLGARVMIPIHYGAFALSYEQLEDPGRWLAELVHERGLEEFVVELAPGESRVFVPPRTQYVKRPDPASFGTPTPGSPPSPPGFGTSAPEPRFVGPASGPRAARVGQSALPAIPASMRIRAVPRPMRAWAPGPGSELDPVLELELEQVLEVLPVTDAIVDEPVIELVHRIEREEPVETAAVRGAVGPIGARDLARRQAEPRDVRPASSPRRGISLDLDGLGDPVVAPG